MTRKKTYPALKVKNPPRKEDLVRLLDIDGEFHIELRYATRNNFTNQVVYDFNDCYIHRHTAELLVGAKDEFKKDGFTVKIWDAYRPHRAQRALWDILPDDNFVAFPPDLKKPYRLRPTHMNGMCVDMTLMDQDNKEILMPTEFDCFSEDANPLISSAPQRAIDNALYLREVMKKHGFSPSNTEWWHFFDISSEPVPFSNFCF